MDTKCCLVCGKEFNRPKGIGYKLWKMRKTCSLDCRIVRLRNNEVGFQNGHSGYKNKTNFKKGHKPWNKDKKIGQPDWLKFEHLRKFHGINKGKKMSDSQRKRMSRARLGKPLFKNRGENHWNWKGGSGKSLRKKIMDTAMYRLWRQSVYERDNWTCSSCDTRGGKLHADHIKPFHKIISDNQITSVQESKMCAELWDVFNGRTLCVSCHMKTDTYGGKRKN